MGPRYQDEWDLGTLGFVLSEASGNRSYETVTIASGAGVLKPGAVLGMVTASKKYVGSPNAEVAGKEGAETATAVLAYGVDASTSDCRSRHHAARWRGEKGLPCSSTLRSIEAAKITAKHTQLAAAGVNIHVR